MSSVVVVGGGYGGVEVAKALDEVADVVLVEPRDAFVHNVAALRALVDPAWAERIFLPYRDLLRRGRVLRDRAVAVSPGSVVLGSGQRLAPDHLVLATGSTYPFPAKVAELDAADGRAAFARTRAELAGAERVVLFGAGPVGLELAGEIAVAWPYKHLTLVDPAPEILTGVYPDELRADLHGQLAGLGVEVLLGAPVDLPPTAPGERGAFTVTVGGREVLGDLWFRCFGGGPVSDYLTGDLAGARTADGHVTVTEHLLLPGQDAVYAIGDLTAVAEPKMARAAGEHARLVAASITAAITGTGERAGYRPGPPGITLPLGPTGGASYSADRGLFGAADTVALKGAHLRLQPMLDMFGMTEARQSG